jgi:thioredoxin 1
MGREEIALMTGSGEKEKRMLRNKSIHGLAGIAVVILSFALGAVLQSTPFARDAKAAESAPLPRLVDVGADKCIPCKMMAPILEELRNEYVGILKVEFVDVWKNPRAGDIYHVKMIPTQIFYDAGGKELYRHIGFMSKEDILKKLEELNLPVKKTQRKQL